MANCALACANMTTIAQTLGLGMYAGILTDAMSLKAIMFLVIIQAVPVVVIYVSLVVGTLSVITNEIQLNDLNYYLPPDVRML